MMDLYLGILLMVALGAATFAATRRLANFGPPWLYDAAAFLTVTLLCGYIWWVWDDVRVAHWLPYSNLIIVGNWFLPMLGVLAGLVWRRLPQSRARRCTATLLLFAAGLYSTVNPVLGEAPLCESNWERLGGGRYFLQTTDATCSAAAAATLLSLHGIATDEQEMADLCLTREGTTWKGLFRGLSLKTEWTPWRVDVFRGRPSDLDDPNGYPVVVCAELRPDAVDEDIYQDEYGWIPGTPHSVVVLGRTEDGQYMVHDPVAGREYWDESELRLLWTGSAVRLVPRDDLQPSLIVSILATQSSAVAH
jgi:hypothetical protein